jgi:poly(beta-D-mannuronate) lyase
MSPLQGPYRAVAGTSGTYTCPPVPPPIRDIDANTFYTDPNHSIVDRERYARNQAATKPLRDYQRAIIRSSDDFLRKRDEAAARCTLDALALWAEADAMLGQMLTIQSGYERKWTLATLSLSYLKIRAAGAHPADRKAEIEAWLVRVAHATQAYYDRPRGGTDTRNNHLAWAALAVAATGVAANDRALFDWGLDRARRFLAQVEPDGSLPLEVARKARAQGYHTFSLMPLVMLAELAAANGIDLYADGAIDRLAKLVIAGLADPAPFAALAGIEQEKVTLGAWQLAWAEPYYARRHDAALLPYLTRLRPLRQDWLGGDLTLAFGVTLPSSP